MESLVTNPSKKSSQKESSKNVSNIKSKESIKTIKSKEFSNPNQSVNKLDESIRSNNSKKESKRNLEENKSTSKDETLQGGKDLNISNASKTSNPDLTKAKMTLLIKAK